MLEKIPDFWQGVLASIVATMAVAIAIKIYGLISEQAKENKNRNQRQIAELRAKMKSSDSVLRVEGYFITLFTLLKYLFIASIIWLLGWILSFFIGIGGIVVAFGSLTVYYFGLRWLYNAQKESDFTSRTSEGDVLTIHSAQYGAGNNQIDVTAKVAECMSKGRLEIYAGNHLGGDPSPENRKNLTVEYTFQGERRTRSVPEREKLSLP